MVDIDYGIENCDSEDEEEYRLEDENNPVDNVPVSSGNAVTVDPSPEQSVTPARRRLLCNTVEWQ